MHRRALFQLCSVYQIPSALLEKRWTARGSVLRCNLDDEKSLGCHSWHCPWTTPLFENLRYWNAAEDEALRGRTAEHVAGIAAAIAVAEGLLLGLVLGALARLASAAGCVPRAVQLCRAYDNRYGEGDAVFWVSDDANLMVDSRRRGPARAPLAHSRSSATAASPG